MDTAYVRGKNPSPKKGVFFWYTLNIVEEVSIWEFPNILFLKDLGRFFFECFFFLEGFGSDENVPWNFKGVSAEDVFLHVQVEGKFHSSNEERKYW